MNSHEHKQTAELRILSRRQDHIWCRGQFAAGSRAHAHRPPASAVDGVPVEEPETLSLRRYRHTSIHTYVSTMPVAAYAHLSTIYLSPLSRTLSSLSSRVAALTRSYLIWGVASTVTVRLRSAWGGGGGARVSIRQPRCGRLLSNRFEHLSIQNPPPDSLVYASRSTPTPFSASTAHFGNALLSPSYQPANLSRRNCG